MKAFKRIFDIVSRVMMNAITKPSRAYQPFIPSDPMALSKTLRPADVLLIEGNQRVSTVIKYMTQSTWSHATMFIGDALASNATAEDTTMLIEMDISAGCVAVPLAKYAHYTTRICRPIRLTDNDRRQVVNFMIERLGLRYDMRNAIDLARYLHPLPFVPIHWRRRMIALGSGEPTRAICSTLIAEAFQTVHYPILPLIDQLSCHDHAYSPHARQEILHIRHHSLYAPRDFDISPYFQIIKPAIESGFDYKKLAWDNQSSHEQPALSGSYDI